MCDPAKTRALNDEFRKTFSGGKLIMTRSLTNHRDLVQIMKRVRTFTEFNEDNDPYGEHDYAAFEHEGELIIWKIDYYNKDLSAGSPDPSDPEATTRVLTVMLADDY